MLTVDIYLTDAFVNLVERFLPLGQLEMHYKLLEVCLYLLSFIMCLLNKILYHFSLLQLSCHGIPWLTIILIFIWILDSKDLSQMQVNFMIGNPRT